MTFKILSLDGGGIRGVLSAKILQEVEHQIQNIHGKKLYEYFDLIAGTSTGSLLAAGVCLKKDTPELLAIYKNRGREIFPESIRNKRKWPALGQLWGFLYPHGDPTTGTPGLSTVLQSTFGDTTIQDIGETSTTAEGKDVERPILLVMAYDTLSRNTTFFASNNPDTNPRWYDKFPLWKICTASASAPTFFPPYELPYHQDVKPGQVLPHIDGGVSANNPALAAVTHALKTAAVQFEDISVLSIGTGKATQPYTYDQIKKWKPIDWITNLPNIFLNPGAEISNAICNQLLNVQDYRHLRLDPELNNHFIDREQGTDPRVLRKINPKPINQLLDPPRYIPEDIDNPDAYDDLIDAAQAYLEKGVVTFTTPEWTTVTVKDAIAQFINRYP